MVFKDHERVYFAFVFACLVGKNLKTPNLNPLAEEAIIQGCIQGLGSPLYICGLT